MRDQLPGRVGDSPLIGAGTYADDATCAISVTGTGEAMIRTVAAHEVSALMRHRDLTLAAACAAVMEQLEPLGAEAGMIALDRAGNVVMPFNTAVMHRGIVRAGRPPETGVGA
jgi:beta-aspartyl-peptidase (threonine type)